MISHSHTSPLTGLVSFWVLAMARTEWHHPVGCLAADTSVVPAPPPARGSGQAHLPLLWLSVTVHWWPETSHGGRAETTETGKLGGFLVLFFPDS